MEASRANYNSHNTKVNDARLPYSSLLPAPKSFCRKSNSERSTPSIYCLAQNLHKLCSGNFEITEYLNGLGNKELSARALLFKMRNALGIKWGLKPYLIR